MKKSEFYEKYWRISDGKGNMVAPPKLTDKEKQALDNLPNDMNVTFFRKRRRPVTINLEYLDEAIHFLPSYFMPANPPKLDEWGSPLEDDQT